MTDDVAAEIQPGQPVTVTDHGQTYEGSVSEVGLSVDTASGLFKIKAVLRDALGLPNGKTVELTTTAYRESRAVLIPSDALYFEDGDTAYVYTVRDGAAVRTDVTVGLYTADTIAVTGGLSGGETVITTWSAGLKDGTPVRLAEETAVSALGEADAAGDAEQ